LNSSPTVNASLDEETSYEAQHRQVQLK